MKACKGLLALPTRRRPVVRTIDPHPLPRSVAQSFANRIHQDVAGFLFQFIVIAQAVIEKVALAIYAMLSGDELFPVLHRRFHSRFARKRNDRMQMIWRKQAETAVPDESLVIESHSGEHTLADARATQFTPARTQ
jgi:hypothetical protein